MSHDQGRFSDFGKVALLVLSEVIVDGVVAVNVRVASDLLAQVTGGLAKCSLAVH